LPQLHKLSQAAVDERLKRGLVESGDWVLLTKGNHYHKTAGINTVKFLRIGDTRVSIKRFII